MSFDEDTVMESVREFCRGRRVEFGSRIRTVANLDAAFDVVGLKGPDARWRTIVSRPDVDDLPSAHDGYASEPAERAAFRRALSEYDRRNGVRPTRKARPWWSSHFVVSATRWAAVSGSIRRARAAGLGWLVPASKDLLLVPRPILRCLEEQPGVLHEDSGRMAVEWADGTGFYYLRGAPFETDLYFEVISSRLSIDEVAQLGNADQRSIALTYLSFDQLARGSRLRRLDTGVKGTVLYRLFLPPRIVRDRVRGYGNYDYFIHMRDASHPEREFIEWVDPRLGAQGNAELCQARAFGISLDDWLSIEQEG